MKPPIRFLALMLCLATVLMGCSRTTTVILPPETTAPTSAAIVPSGTGETVAPTDTPTGSAPTSAPTTEPSTVPPTEEPATAPTTEPAIPTENPNETEPYTEPTAIPTTEPITEPTTEPEPSLHPVYDISRHSIGSLEYNLLDAINAKRTDSSLESLTLNSTLCALAAIRAYECSESFSLTRPDGRSGYSVLTDYSYAVWSDFSQRIHYGSAGMSANTIVKGWMYTNEFSANILSGDFTHIGIGVYTSGGTTYIVCFFAG